MPLITPRPPMHRVWLLTFATVITVLCINGALAYKALGDLTRNQQSIVNTLGTIATIKDTYTTLLTAEADQRGYLLTGESKYLPPFQQAIAAVDDHIQHLYTATADSPAQRALVKELRIATDEKTTELKEAITELQERLRANNATPVPLGLTSGQGMKTMNRVQNLINQLEQGQYKLLAQREIEARKSHNDALMTLLTAAGVSLLLIILIYLLVRRSNRTYDKLTMELQRANEELEAKVKERTAVLSHYAHELQRSNRELQDFAFVASHDLQEPLRKIRAFGNRLQHRYAPALGSQGADYIGRMHAAAERMSRLINDLLAFSRVATKGKAFQQIALGDIFAGVIEDLEVAIEETGAQIALEELPVIEADPTQMRQLFQNLLGNAIKFTQPGFQPQITVTGMVHNHSTIDDIPVDNVCEIVISDKGIGFEQQFVDRIFTPFQRLHGRERYEGTGIGLAVCRRIVERHHGCITAESIPGEGARFLVKLPVKQAIQSLDEIHDHDI